VDAVARDIHDDASRFLLAGGEHCGGVAFAPAFADFAPLCRPNQGGKVLIRMRQNMTFQLAAALCQRVGQHG